MQLALLAQYSLAAQDVNEDRAVCDLAHDAAWLLDGATGLTPDRVLPGASDARWFVDEIFAGISAGLAAKAATPDVLKGAVDHAADAFAKAALRPDAPPEHMPCASFVMTRLLDGTTLELTNLGDCVILLREVATGRVSPFGTSRLRALDAVVEKEIGTLLAGGLHHAAARERVLPMIVRHRSRMNEDDGYWILDLSPRCLAHLEQWTLPAHPGNEILLMSDGFSRLVDTFCRYDWAGLFAKSAVPSGIAHLMAELREIERADATCRAHPRYKVSDDATAMLLRVSADWEG
jgi:hypothetical protein